MRSLARRERILLLAGGVTLLLTLGALFLPALGRRTRDWREQLRTAQANLEEFDLLKGQYETLRTRLAGQPVARSGAPSLFTAMDLLAQQSRIAKDQIASITPSSSPPNAEIPLEFAEVKIERLTLKQLNDYLVNVETYREKRIRTDRLHIKKRADKPELLDAMIRVQSLATARRS